MCLMLCPSTATRKRSFGAFQFEDHVDYDHEGFGLQKVPGSPTQVEMGAAVPSAGDYRMSYARKSSAVIASRH